MDNIHQMLPEDEIILCGSVLLLGIVAGALVRLVFSWRERGNA